MSSIVKNYRSDIVIAIRMELAGVGMPIPSHDFVLRFFTEYEHRHYDVGRRGGRLRHCELDETGYVLTCYLKNHGLGVGELQCLFIDLAPVSGMEDGIQRTYSLTTVDSVELVDGNGDDSTSIEAQIAIDINAVLSELGATKEAILSEWGLLRVEAEHQIENARMAVDEALAAATKADNARSSVISWKTVIDGQLQTAMGNMLDRVELTESDAFGGYNIADFIFNNGTRKQMKVRNGIVPTSMPARNVSVEGIQTDSGDVHPWEPQNAQNAFAELRRDMRDALVINLTAMPGNSFSIEEEYKQQLFRVNRVNGGILHTVSYIKQWREVHPDGEILYAFSVGDNRAKMYARAVLFDTDSIQAICFNGPEYFILQHYTKGVNDAVNTVVSKCYNFATVKNVTDPEQPVEMDAEAIEESGLTPTDIQMEGGIVDPEISYSEDKTDDMIEESKNNLLVTGLCYFPIGRLSEPEIVDDDAVDDLSKTFPEIREWAEAHPDGIVTYKLRERILGGSPANHYFNVSASAYIGKTEVLVEEVKNNKNDEQTLFVRFTHKGLFEDDEYMEDAFKLEFFPLAGQGDMDSALSGKADKTVVVNLTQIGNTDTYTPDKTFADIAAAIDAGKQVEYVDNNGFHMPAHYKSPTRIAGGIAIYVPWGNNSGYVYMFEHGKTTNKVSIIRVQITNFHELTQSEINTICI